MNRVLLAVIFLVSIPAAWADEFPNRSATSSDDIDLRPQAAKTRLGIILGSTATQIELMDVRYRFTVGLHYEWDLTSNFSLVPGIAYVQRGASKAIETAAGPGQIDFNLDYWEVPIFFKARLDGETVKPFAESGPYVAYAYRRIMQVSVNGNTEQTALDDAANRFDWGLESGVGVDFAITPGFLLGTEARYTLGLAEPDSAVIGHTRGYQFLVRTSFDL